MLAGKGVGVFSVRKEHHFYVHAVFQQQVDTAQGRLDTGCIAVIQDRDVTGEAVYQADLSLREGRTRRGDHVFDPGLMHGNHIRVAFHQEAAISLYDRLLGEIDPVKLIALMINLTFGRVDIFGRLFVFLQDASSESNNFSTERMDRKNDTPAKTIVYPAVVVGDHQTCLFEKYFFVTALYCGFIQGVPLVEAVA